MSAIRACLLHVEDDENDVLLFRRAVHKVDPLIHVEAVSDGDAAVAYLSGQGEFANRAQHPLPAFVVLDLKLPRRSGLEVLRWMRHSPGPLRRLPVAVLSASTQEEDVHAAYEAGANSYLAKPVDFETLREMARTLILYWLTVNTRPV